MMRLKLCVLFFAVSSMATAQSNDWLLIDSLTREPIAFAHIYAEEAQVGTISNIKGSFGFPYDITFDTLVFTHIAYQSKKIPTSDIETLEDTIYLLPDIIYLDEILVTDTEVTNIVDDIIRTIRNSQNQYAKAYYLQTSFKGGNATEWIEAFYEIDFSMNGLNKLKIDQARFARKKSDRTSVFISHTNFSYLTVGNNIYAPATGETENRLAKPFAQDFSDGYDFFVDRQFTRNSDTYLQIRFEPNEKIHTEISSYGQFVYNTSKDRLIQYTGIIDHPLGTDQLEYEGESEMDIAIENPKYTYVFNFSEQKGEIDHISVDLTYEVVESAQIIPSRVSSKFIVYQKLDRQPKKLREPGLELEDVSLFENAKYKPKFWRDNQVIKLTPEEEAIIATFEKENAFGTYFKR